MCSSVPVSGPPADSYVQRLTKLPVQRVDLGQGILIGGG
jgi:hypothetical protein